MTSQIEAWDRVCAIVAIYVPDSLQREETLDRLMPWGLSQLSGTPAQWREGRAQLARFQKALEGLGPEASLCLASALSLEMKSCDSGGMMVSSKDSYRVIMTAGRAAITIANRYVKRGRPPAVKKRALADRVAGVYLDLTGKTPPTTQVVANDPGDCLYHQLAKDVFATWGLLDGWGSNARQAALRLSKKSSHKKHN